MLFRTKRAKVVEFVNRWDARLDRSYLRWRDRNEKRPDRFVPPGWGYGAAPLAWCCCTVPDGSAVP